MKAGAIQPSQAHLSIGQGVEIAMAASDSAVAMGHDEQMGLTARFSRR
jgi:hypothetical protein